jgi:hypothetical protein
MLLLTVAAVSVHVRPLCCDTVMTQWNGMTLVDYALLAELAYFDTDDTQVPLQQVLMKYSLHYDHHTCLPFCGVLQCLHVSPIHSNSHSVAHYCNKHALFSA